MKKKDIIAKTKAGSVPGSNARAISPVLRRVRMKEANEEVRDWQYWLSQPVAKRAEAITFLVSQMLKKGQRIDKTIVNRIKLK